MGHDYRIEYDWYPDVIPQNVEIGEDVFIDSSYGWAEFYSNRQPGAVFGEASGVFDRVTLVVGPEGRVSVGAYTELNATFLICRDRIDIGSHVLLAWGCVVTDHWIAPETPVEARRKVLRSVVRDPRRKFPRLAEPKPVVIEDNVWFGFDCVVLPGVTVGRGSIIGAKTVIREDVPPYSIVVGEPARVIRTMDATDTPEARESAFRKHLASKDDTGGNIRGTL